MASVQWSRSLLSGLVLATLYLACSSSPEPGSAGAAGSAGAKAGGGGGPPGGRAGRAGSAGSAKAGQAGQPLAGSSASAGAAGAADAGASGSPTEPLWAPTGALRGCTIDRLTNPPTQHAFTWRPCDWTSQPGCEQADFDGLVTFGPYTIVHAQMRDDGQTVRGAFYTYTYQQQVATVIDEEGRILEAYSNQDTSCTLGVPCVQGDHYGISAHKKGAPKSGLLLGRLGQDPMLTDVTVDPDLSTSAVTWYDGNAKQIGWMVGITGLVGFDLDSGKQHRFAIADQLKGPSFSFVGLRHAGDHWLYSEFYGDASKKASRVLISDGLSLGKPYLNSPPGVSDGNPLFADSHVAWFRGFNQLGTNFYERVELWSSPFSPDGSKLTPTKLADYSGTWVAMSERALNGGMGKIAYTQDPITTPGQEKPIHVRVYDLVTRQKWELPLPQDQFPLLIGGVTRTHVWFTTDQGDNSPRWLYRWKLAEVPPTP